MSSLRSRPRPSVAVPTCIAVVAALFVACGGAVAPPGGTTRVTQAPAGGGQDNDFDVKAAFEPAAERLGTLGSWRFTSAVNGVGLTPRESTLVGIERRKPVAARSFDYADSAGQYKFVYIDGKAWRTNSTEDTAKGNFTVSAPTVGNGSKDDPFAIESWWPTVVGAARYFTLVGEEPIAGVDARHFRFTDEEGRKRYLKDGKIAAADWTGDVWIAKDAGHVLRVAFGGPIVPGGPRDDIQFSYEVSDIGCSCPIDPPANVAP